MKTNPIEYDVVVVGGGPAGYIAAIKASQLGAKTAIAERSVVGGTCLNRGCIPTKTYLRTAEIIQSIRQAAERGLHLPAESMRIDMNEAVAHKNRVVKKLTNGVAVLLKSNRVDTYAGEARIHADRTVVVGDQVLITKKVILAGGSKAAKLNLPGMEHERILTSDTALDLKSIPDHIVIIGGGVIGVEMATIYASFGSHVTIVEIMDRLLPLMDEDISAAIRNSLQAMDVVIHTGTKLERVVSKGDAVEVHTDKVDPIEASHVLLSIGRVPDTDAVDGLDIQKNRGYIATDDTMKSSIDWIYAPGDINGRMMLAHAAYHMGEVAAENAATNASRPIDLRYVPSCVYSLPEIGSVGLTQAQAEKSQSIQTGIFPFSANGRALASGETEGFVKVIIDSRYGEILGVHIVGPMAAEIINEAAALMTMEVTAHEVTKICHGHPAFSEAFMEAAANAIGECLHLPPRK